MNLITLAASSMPDAAPIEMLEAAGAAGFDGVGLRIGAPPGHALPFPAVVGNRRLIQEIKKRIADADLQVLDIYSFYLTPEFDVTACRSALEVGAELGAKYAVVIGRDAEWSRARDRFAQICDLAAPFGLTASIEFAPHRYPATLDQALRLLAEADRPNSSLMPDPAHLLGSGGVPSDLSSVNPHWLRYSQYCDVNFPGTGAGPPGGALPQVERRLPGKGRLHLAEWMSALPPDVPLSLECTPRPESVSFAAWAKLIYGAMRIELDNYYLDESRC